MDFERRWQKEGDELHTTVPSMTYPANSSRDNFYAYSDANVDRGDLLRLQDLRLSYSFKASKRYRMQGLRIYFNAANLGILWKATKSYVDPDFPGQPLARTYALGLKLSM